MDDSELESIVLAEINDAKAFIDEDVGAERAAAIRFYKGEPFGDEEEGRSQVVSRDVQDTVNAYLPSVLRIFFGSEKPVEFAPQGPEDVEMAEQATDYVNYVVMRQNEGYAVLQAAIMDALRSKVGIVKWWMDEAVSVNSVNYTGLDEMSLALIAEGNPGEVSDAEQAEDGTWSVTITTRKSSDKVCIAAVPPEEFLIDRRARTVEDATLVGHRRMATVSELVAMGYDKDEVIQHAGDGEDLETSDESLARQRTRFSFAQNAGSDESTRLVEYVEAYVKVDFDGDGIAELRKVCVVGTKVFKNEPCEERPFADFHTDPEPHTFFGTCPAEKVMDLQRIKSVVLRNSLDSMSLSIFPRAVVLEDSVNLDDAMNTEVGALIRAKRLDAYQPVAVPPVFEQGLSALSYMDQVKEQRTGMSKVALGLDPKALRGTSATAAAGQFTQAQQHIELVARNLAETGMKRLFRGVLRLIARNPRKEPVTYLRNKEPVQIDPRSWRNDMDVVCNVALGGGTDEQKFAVLSQMAQKQEQVLQVAGPNNGLVTPKNLYNTYAKLTQLGGFKAVDLFFTDPGDEPPQPPEPQPDPKMVEAQNKAQIEMAKLQQEGQIAMARLEQEAQLKREQMAAEMALKREQMQLETELKLLQPQNTMEPVRMGGEVG